MEPSICGFVWYNGFRYTRVCLVHLYDGSQYTRVCLIHLYNGSRYTRVCLLHLYNGSQYTQVWLLHLYNASQYTRVCLIRLYNGSRYTRVCLVGVGLLAAWFQTDQRVSLADVSKRLDKMAAQVRTHLATLDPTHPALNTEVNVTGQSLNSLCVCHCVKHKILWLHMVSRNVSSQKFFRLNSRCSTQ